MVLILVEIVIITHIYVAGISVCMGKWLACHYLTLQFMLKKLFRKNFCTSNENMLHQNFYRQNFL